MREDSSEADWLSLNVYLELSKKNMKYPSFRNKVYLHKKMLYFCEEKFRRARNFSLHAVCHCG